ncbi:MAG: efflux RND transporter periplasmic adaptor subunit [Balneolales bacterium]
MHKYSSLPVWALLLAVVPACDNSGLENGNNEAPENDRTRVVAVETMVVEPGLFQDAVNLSGTVESMNDAVISAEASGRVLEIQRRGSEVAAGEVVAQLEEAMLQANLDVARATYEMAQDAFERQEPLFEEEIITPLEFSMVRSQRDQARAQLDQAETQLENASITAPFDGRVEERMVETGEVLSPGNPVLRLVNTRQVRISAGVPERYSNEIGEGSVVTVNLEAYGGNIREAVITFSGNVINAQTRTYPIEVEVDNPDRFMKPQMTVELMVTRSFLEDVITIPRTALVRDESGQNVFVVNRTGERPVAEFRPVSTGRSSAGNILISDGLFSGDEIIVAGLGNLNVGDVVRVDEVRD